MVDAAAAGAVAVGGALRAGDAAALGVDAAAGAGSLFLSQAAATAATTRATRILALDDME